MARKVRINPTAALSLYDDMPLSDLLGWLERATYGMSDEIKGVSLIDLERGDVEYGDPPTIEVYYLRDETPAETEARERGAREEAARRQAQIYARERATYEVLKAKFEPKS